MPSQFARAGRRCGFTLVEILVVIGIIVILAAILVPMIGRAMRQAKQTRTAADMQSIGTALEAFKADHGDYPRTTDLVNTGAATLGRYLSGPLGDGVLPGTTNNDPDDPPAPPAGQEFAPGDVYQVGGTRYVALKSTATAPPGTPDLWAPCGNHLSPCVHDGADGPGIRVRAGGKKYGPYVTTEKMKMRGIAFIDGNGNPILYFPASPGKINVTGTQPVYVNRVTMPSPAVTAGASKASIKYDADDNLEAFRRGPGEADAAMNASPLHRIRAMLGDYNNDGRIDTSTGEKVVTEAPYLLWAAGTDGRFGPDADATMDFAVLNVTDVDKCDDVTNFKQ